MSSSTGGEPGLPLEGIKVLEFGQFIAAPAAGQILADLGAEVIKVESPAGDQSRSIGPYGEGMLWAFNRGKKSVVLDLKDPGDLAVARQLATDVDVLLHNTRAGAIARLGLDYASLRPENPKLIYASVSGFGRRGPGSDRAGLDIAAQAESGMMSINGEQGGAPLRVGFPVVDMGAAYSLVQAVLAALFHRTRTGEGANLEVSLLQVAVHLQSPAWGEWQASGVLPIRKGNGQVSLAPAADVIETCDGSLVLSAYSAPHWRTLCEVLGLERLVADPRFGDNATRVRNRAELLAELSAVTRTMTSEVVLEKLRSHGLVVAAVADYSEVSQSGDVRDNDLLVSGVASDGRTFEVPGLPFTFVSGLTTSGHEVVPGLGEHTREYRND